MQCRVSESAPRQETHQAPQKLYLQLEARPIRVFKLSNLFSHPFSNLRRPINFPEPLNRQFCPASLPGGYLAGSLRLSQGKVIPTKR